MEEELFLIKDSEMNQEVEVDFMKDSEDLEESICEMDEMFEPDQYSDKYKNTQLLLDTLSEMQSTTEFQQKFFDKHIVHIHVYKLNYPSFKDIHKEIDAKHFRNMLEECDKIIDNLIYAYDCYRWFPVDRYYNLIELILDVLKYVTEMEEIEDMMASLSHY